MTDVLVVGAGITGLSAAWEAMRAGARVTLVEASGQVGGKVRTERVDGFAIEHGPDSFVAYRPAALSLIADLGMTDEVVTVGGSRVVHLRADGRLLPLPDAMGMVLPTRMVPFVTTPILTWRHKARAGLDLVLPRRLGASDTSAGAFLRARLGDGVVDRFAQPLIGGIYGAGIDELSLDAVLPTLRASEAEHRSLMVASLAQGRDARRRARASGAPTPGSPFRSLRTGLGALPERLAADVRAGGADVRLATRVERLDTDSTGTAATFSDGSVERFDAVILAVGAAAMADLVESRAPAAAVALRTIPHSTTTVVTLAYPHDCVRLGADLPGVARGRRGPHQRSHDQLEQVGGTRPRGCRPPAGLRAPATWPVGHGTGRRDPSGGHLARGRRAGDRRAARAHPRDPLDPRDADVHGRPPRPGGSRGVSPRRRPGVVPGRLGPARRRGPGVHRRWPQGRPGGGGRIRSGACIPVACRP